MVGRPATPARSKTPTRSKTPMRTQPSRGKTPTRGSEGSLSPAPSLPAPAGKPVVVSSAHIPFDPVAVWLASEKDSDVVFASERHCKALGQKIGDHFQPFEHCNPLHFPPVARIYGLERWKPVKLQSNRSRGPTCVAGGKLLKCHKSSLPAFLYTLSDGDRCANASNRGLPTLVFSYRINKDGFLAPFACWSCFSNGDSRCSIARTQFEQDPAILQTILDSAIGQTLHPNVEQGHATDAEPRAQHTNVGDAGVCEEHPAEQSASHLADRSTLATDRLATHDRGDSFSQLTGSNPPPAPRKALSRTATAAGLDEAHFPRKLLLKTARTQDQATQDQDKSGYDLARSKSPDGGALQYNPLHDPIDSVDVQTLFGKRVHSAPAPKVATLLRAASATRAVSQGPVRSWRDIVQDIHNRKADIGPTRADLEPSSATVGASTELLPPFREAQPDRGESNHPRTPTPAGRSKVGHATPAMTPRRFMDVDNISKGVLVAKQELGRIAANIRQAMRIVDEAEKAAQQSLDETTTACSTLKENVQAERDLVHTFRQEREENASNLEGMQKDLLELQNQLREKTAAFDETKDQLRFAETAIEQLYEQNQMTKRLWKDSVGKVKTLEESTGSLKDELDVHKEEAARGQRREAILIEHKQALESALLHASEENAALLDRISRLEAGHSTPIEVTDSGPARSKSLHMPTVSTPTVSTTVVQPLQSMPAEASKQTAMVESSQIGLSIANPETRAVQASTLTEAAVSVSTTRDPSASATPPAGGTPPTGHTLSEERPKEREKSVPGTWFD